MDEILRLRSSDFGDEDARQRDKMNEPLQQAAAIPFQRQDDEIRFCLITSMKRKRWIFPKGIIDPGETPAQTALKEASEEAGLSGRIVGAPLGEYADFKWGMDLVVSVLLMEVQDVAADWLEARYRKRKWVSGKKAHSMLEHNELKNLLDRAIKTITNGDSLRAP